MMPFFCRAGITSKYSGFKAGAPSGTRVPSISLATANTYFVFYMYNGYVGIYKMVSNGSSITSTLIANNSSNTALTTSGTTVTPSANRYGSTMIAYTFDGDADEVVSALQSFDYVRLAGRNSATASTVSYTFTTEDGDTSLFHAIGDWWIQCTGEYWCIYSVSGLPNTPTMTTGLPSRMPTSMSADLTTARRNTSTGISTNYLTTDKDYSVLASVHGGSIISCRRK